MALPVYIKKHEIDWILKVTRSTSRFVTRDLCIVALYFGTPCTTLEINRITIGDVLSKTGGLNRKFDIRGSLSYNQSPREVYLTSKKLKGFLMDYLREMAGRKINAGPNPDYYMSLNPDAPLIVTRLGGEYSIVKRKRKSGAVGYTCDALNRHVRSLLSKGGVEQPSILSGRRTFAVNLKRLGYDVVHIHHLLGYGKHSLDSTIRLLLTDPVDMGRIAAEAF